MGDFPFHYAAFDRSHANCHNRRHQLILFMGRLLGAYTKACEKEKKKQDKRYIKNWIPISLNFDIEIISKMLSRKLKSSYLA